MNHVFGKTEKDFMGRRLTNSCWNGQDQHDFCGGWVDINRGVRCECPCHDPRQPKARKVKPVSLPLPDTGTIDVK